MDRSDVGLSQYSYDELSQLLTAKLPDGDLQTYTFDPVGNRLSLQDQRGTQRYRYDSADQLVDVESDFNPEEADETGRLMVSAAMSDASPGRQVWRTRYGFDDAGNEVSKVGPGHKTTSYGFDSLERLNSVDSPGSVPERYQYDSEGRRIAIVQGQTALKVRFLRHARGRPVLLELDGSGKPMTRYVILPSGQLLARVGPVDSKSVFYHFDALGSTVALTDSSSRILARFSYDPFGRSVSMPVTREESRFVGRLAVVEETSGPLEMGARFYDPSDGRFLSVDLLRRLGGIVRLAAYAYARGNPVRWTDSLGLEEDEEEGAADGDGVSDEEIEENIEREEAIEEDIVARAAKPVLEMCAAIKKAAELAAKEAAIVAACAWACHDLIWNWAAYVTCEVVCHAAAMVATH